MVAKSPGAALGVGLSFLGKPDLEGALVPLGRAEDLDSGDPWPPLLRSEALEKLGRAADALLASDVSVSRAPEAAVVYERRARVLARLDRFAEAAKDFERAVALDPSSASRLDAELKAARDRAAGKP
jgi:tetratricopeptide (TPR) repeat protein